MKRTIKIFSFLLVMMMLFTNVAFAADASVTYEGGAENYVFLPGSEYTDTDLFDNFKGVMPGDEIDQKITVKNEQGKCDRVKIYMRAVPHDDQANPLSEGVAANETVATLTREQLKEIAEIKMPDLNCYDLEAAMKTVAGTARNMGVKVEE